MASDQWSWDRREHFHVLQILSTPATDLCWCEQVESTAGNALVGKVMCVCAAASIAKAALSSTLEEHLYALSGLNLLLDWIDNPTDEQFERICGLIFGENDPSADWGPHGVVWWALRTATSSVGNYEAGWALHAVCDAAVAAGFSPEQLRTIVELELLARAR